MPSIMRTAHCTRSAEPFLHTLTKHINRASIIMHALIVGAAIVAGAAAASFHRLIVLPASFDSNPPSSHPYETMAAVSYSRRGDASVLEFRRDHPRPTLRPGQILIRVEASSINPCDFKFRRAKGVPSFLLPLPKIPGEDVAGVVVAISEEEDEDPPVGHDAGGKFRVGDRVAAMLPLLGSRWGSAAEYVAVDSSLAARVGDRTSFVDAASLPLVSLTVVQALSGVAGGVAVRRHPGGEVGADDEGGGGGGGKKKKILIHAGAGGVGTFAIQYAKGVLGMSVATTASGEKRRMLEDLGADVVVDYRTTRLEEEVRDCDAVLDTMSWAYEGRTLGRGSRVLKPGGRYVNVLSSDWSLSAGGGGENANGILTARNFVVHGLRNLVRGGSVVPAYDVVAVVPNGEQLQMVMDWLEEGTIRAVVDRTFPLSEASAAYEYLERGHATGKVVLVH